MRLVHTINDVRDAVAQARKQGKTIGFVPTMGALHAGHGSLIERARKECGFVVVSIFVNPTQFGTTEDFNKYPRTLDADSKLCEAAGADCIFAPSAEQMYPQTNLSWVDVEAITEGLCGAARPGHFRGVTTVVSKLFNIVAPHVALFGKKDYQQLAVIRRMTADLNMAVEIVGMPIVREGDGLAMSSRNSYLSPEERRTALCLSRGIAEARRLFLAGERESGRLKGAVAAVIAAEALASPEYLELRDGETLEEVARAGGGTLLALAVRIGRTRLIDNCILGEPD